MPIRPGSSPLIYNSTVSPTCSGTIYVDAIDYTEVFQNFDRLEYSNPKLREAHTSTGATPLIVQTFGNQPFQLLTTCTGDVPRPLGPDDTNIAFIKQRFNILRYTIKGAANVNTDVNNLFAVFQAHLQLLDQFALYLEELQMELSIGYLENNLQPYNFAYLINPTFSMTGNAIGGFVNYLIISEFAPSVAYEALLPDGSGDSAVFMDFSMIVNNYTVSSRHL